MLLLLLPFILVSIHISHVFSVLVAIDFHLPAFRLEIKKKKNIKNNKTIDCDTVAGES